MCDRIPVSIACVDLRSAFNTGSIFRTADAVQCEKVYLCGYTPFPPHDKLSRTSRGTHETVPWEHRASILELIHEQQERGVHIMAVETEARSIPFTDIEYPRPLMLIVGNEAEGLPDEVISRSDSIVSIPMKGVKNSLNVAVAAGIVLYQALHQGF